MRWLTAGRQDSYDLDSLQILSGRRFRYGQPEVMLGDLLAQEMNKKPGDTMDIQGTPFTVTGIYHGPSALEADAVILPLDQLQQLSSLQGKVSTIHVKLRPAPAGVQQQAYMRQAESAIEALLPGLKAVPAEERASNNQLVQAGAGLRVGHVVAGAADRHSRHRQHHGHVGLRAHAKRSEFSARWAGSAGRCWRLSRWRRRLWGWAEALSAFFWLGSAARAGHAAADRRASLFNRWLAAAG